MTRIQRLPEDLVNKIAAGEVVERPASVVKELVENSLDAGARSITVRIEGGGQSLIRVLDDGHGMGREDAESALERHATSKIRELRDLQSIGTHGFRGEALPSIASVSHLVLRTHDGLGSAGTEVEMRFGKLVQIKEAAQPRGTTVEVRDLFGAVPARRKFLRSEATEAGHIAETMTVLALAHPATGFHLVSGRRDVIQAPPVSGLAERIYQLFGDALLEELLPVEWQEDWARIQGFVSRPDRRAPSRGTVRLFVNSRAVRDRAVARAVVEAYRAAGVGDPRPETFLFLELPKDMVDVNVHPAKAEVRFAEPRIIWRAVQEGVGRSLSAGVRREAPRADTGRVEEAVTAYVARGGPRRLWGDVSTSTGSTPEAPETDAEVAATGALPREAPAVIGQHRSTYIIASDGEDLFLFDQHTAHERVRFEALLPRVEKRAVETQLLLAPRIVDLPPRLRPVVEAQGETLSELGFAVEAFGGETVRLSAVPGVISGDPLRTLVALLEELLERETGDAMAGEKRDRLVATLACHSAVRAGQSLSVDAMTAIVHDLTRTRHPTLCPHGRPTVVRIAKDDVSRWFGRTGWARR